MALKKTKKKQELPPPPVDTCSMVMNHPLFNPEQSKSNSVKLVERIDDVVKAIEYHRSQHTYHINAAANEKERLHVSLLNHAELKAQLLAQVEVPKLAV